LQEQAPNHLKLRWLRAMVVTVKENHGKRLWQVRFRETSNREPLMRCRNTIDDIETGG
jgi:hypothetical protein